jgi:hypothetical protein
MSGGKFTGAGYSDIDMKVALDGSYVHKDGSSY